MLQAGALAQSSAGSPLSRHPYPQMATQESVVIVWRTVGETVPIVRYGPQPYLLINEVLPDQTLVRIGPDVPGAEEVPRLHSAPPGTYQYETSIRGLEPGTKYYYAVFDGDRVLAGVDFDHSFTTLPAADSTGPLRLWVVGDSGNGSAAQIAGFDGMRRFVSADGKAIDAYLHLGDMAYSIGRDSEFSRNFFDIYTDLLRHTVVWPTMGNHEGANSSGVTQTGPYYDAYVVPTEGESGGLPSGTEAYYAFDIGRVHFICLDSHDLSRSATGDMALWLKADLEMVDADWLIAFWHHPPYTKGTHDSDTEYQLVEMRRHIMPILESGGVDLVLGGHSHIYERSMLIDGAYATPTTADGVVFDDGDGDPDGNGAYRKSGALNPREGTVALVAGNGRSATSLFGISPVMRSTIAEVGSVILDIEGDTLTGKMLNSDGVVRDQFQVIKRGLVTPQIVDSPWQPTGPSFVIERLQPGLTSIEIDAVPARPDAVIHYTIDGSVPTASSPIYSGPLLVSDSTRVRAFSLWQGGERMSLITEPEPLDDFVSIQKYITSPDDDGRQDLAGNLDLGGTTLGLGDGGIVGLRFRDVRIPADAYLVRAQVQFEKSAGSFELTSGEIWAELAAESLPFTGQPQEFSSRPRTARSVPWQPGGWTMSAARDFQSATADLRGLLAEVITQPGWQSGNAMSLFFSQSADRRVQAYESGRARAASLVVIFIDPAGLTERLTADPLVIDASVGVPAQVRFRWPGPEAAQALGLSLQLEGSPDLRSWAPITPLQLNFGFINQDGFRPASAIIPPDRVAGQRQNYFRLRVFQDAQAP